MPDRHFLTALALGVLVFGLSISGCNRDARVAARAPAKNIKPAEVLAVSVYRPSIPGPSVLPGSEAIAARPAPRPYSAPFPAANDLVGPVYSDVISRPALPLIQPSPDLVVARADLSGSPAGARSFSLPAAAPFLRMAPIPELDPDRFRPARTGAAPAGRVAAAAPRPIPSNRLEIQRALAPLPEQAVQPPTPRVAAAHPGWISSPSMAMRTGY
ncbi:MAG: hypothetical protein LBU64_14370 [Planctomycetota bacterium]|jgi:hypothetical protein|nr:hypothetical protein [Planctomycetota bacterium]